MRYWWLFAGANNLMDRRNPDRRVVVKICVNVKAKPYVQTLINRSVNFFLLFPNSESFNHFSFCCRIWNRVIRPDCPKDYGVVFAPSNLVTH